MLVDESAHDVDCVVEVVIDFFLGESDVIGVFGVAIAVLGILGPVVLDEVIHVVSELVF